MARVGSNADIQDITFETINSSIITADDNNTVTITDSDLGTVIRLTHTGGAITVNLPNGLDEGFKCELIVDTTQTVTFSGIGGATIEAITNVFSTQYQRVLIEQKSQNVWGIYS